MLADCLAPCLPAGIAAPLLGCWSIKRAFHVPAAAAWKERPRWRPQSIGTACFTLADCCTAAASLCSGVKHAFEQPLRRRRQANMPSQMPGLSSKSSAVKRVLWQDDLAAGLVQCSAMCFAQEHPPSEAMLVEQGLDKQERANSRLSRSPCVQVAGRQQLLAYQTDAGTA